MAQAVVPQICVLPVRVLQTSNEPRPFVVIQAVDALERSSQSTIEIEFHGRWVPHIEKFVTSGRRSRTVVSIAGFRYSQEPKLKAVVDLDDDDRKTNVWIRSFDDIRRGWPFQEVASAGSDDRRWDKLGEIDMLQFVGAASHISQPVDARRSRVNLVAVVCKFQSGFATNGTDWKVTLYITDQSLLEPDSFVIVNIFHQQESLPEDIRPGDIVCIRSGLVQYHRNRMQIVVDKRNSHLLVFNRDASEADDASQPYFQFPDENIPSVTDHERWCIEHRASSPAPLPSPAPSANGMDADGMPHHPVLSPLFVSMTPHDAIAISPVKTILSCLDAVAKFHCRLRVAAFWPASVQQFCQRMCPQCEQLTNGFSTCLGCNSEDTIWTWLFVLRCEDATGSIDVICTQNEATNFLGGIAPCDLQVNTTACEQFSVPEN
ncbi:unnamed protein product (mitochondrion) [Plasmodiophora brassicae]|uniref:Telomeric single stranded DNA binding POT1/Cdc13 domain-containing protein n=1 Tax=Plasmodiophora brassicae TaxID=37360 RepID=A0A3P3XZY2_PLABS|nr:unnamed protein product [Plasmodiophora brassicae]